MPFRGGSRLTALATAVICAAAFGCASTAASAAPRSFAVKTPHVEGPAKYDRAYVNAFGSPKADDVLILMPGTFGGAGDFTLAAKEMVRKNRNLQVLSLIHI